MLRWRLSLGVLLIAGLAGLCWLDARAAWPGAWLMPLWLVVCALAAGEMQALFRSGGHEPWAPLVVGGTVCVGAVGAIDVYRLVPGGGRGGLAASAGALAAVTLAAFLVEMGRFRQASRTSMHLGLALLAAAYVGLLGSFFVYLRLLGDGSRGLLALVSVIVVVKASDTGAYAGGRIAGRRKLAPRLSPGKTWEGAASGLALAVAGGMVVFFALGPWGWPDAPRPSMAAVVGYSVVTALAGMFGDLAESLLKRDLGRKDSSDWLPGFGGVLDVIDSLLFAVPVAYACWAGGLLG